MEESEDNMSAKDERKVDSSSAVKKTNKRSIVERELETNLTARVTSPVIVGEGQTTSRYGRARRLKAGRDIAEARKLMSESLKTPGTENTPVKVQSPVYKMHASNSPNKVETPKKALETNLDNQIDSIYQENKSLSRFSAERNGSPAKKFPKVYIRKDLIQNREEDDNVLLIKNLFSPTKTPQTNLSKNNCSTEKYNSKLKNGLVENSSVVKTLDFDGNKKKKENKDSKAGLSKNELFELEAHCPYQVGDLAWARMGTFPFWPCIITRDPSTRMFVKKKLFGRVEHDILHVTFFGDNGRRSWIVDNMLRKYLGQLEFESTREKFTIEDKKKDPRLYAAFFVSEKKQALWNTSVEEAETLLREPKRLRIDIFNDMLWKCRASRKQQKGGKITRTDSDVSLSESLYDSLFSEDDTKKDDTERSRKRTRNKSFDVSDVVTACLDNMAAKTGITKIQRQSHMDKWLQKAKSKTPEKTQAKSQIIAPKVDKVITQQVDKNTTNKSKKRVSPKIVQPQLKPYRLRRSIEVHKNMPTNEYALENSSLNDKVESLSESSGFEGLGIIAKVESLAENTNIDKNNISIVVDISEDTDNSTVEPINATTKTDNGELIKDTSAIHDDTTGSSTETNLVAKNFTSKSKNNISPKVVQQQLKLYRLRKSNEAHKNLLSNKNGLENSCLGDKAETVIKSSSAEGLDIIVKIESLASNTDKDQEDISTVVDISEDTTNTVIEPINVTTKTHNNLVVKLKEVEPIKETSAIDAHTTGSTIEPNSKSSDMDDVVKTSNDCKPFDGDSITMCNKDETFHTIAQSNTASLNVVEKHTTTKSKKKILPKEAQPQSKLYRLRGSNEVLKNLPNHGHQLVNSIFNDKVDTVTKSSCAEDKQNISRRLDVKEDTTNNAIKPQNATTKTDDTPGVQFNENKPVEDDFAKNFITADAPTKLNLESSDIDDAVVKKSKDCEPNKDNYIEMCLGVDTSNITLPITENSNIDRTITGRSKQVESIRDNSSAKSDRTDELTNASSNTNVADFEEYKDDEVIQDNYNVNNYNENSINVDTANKINDPTEANLTKDEGVNDKSYEPISDITTINYVADSNLKPGIETKSTGDKSNLFEPIEYPLVESNIMENQVEDGKDIRMPENVSNEHTENDKIESKENITDKIETPKEVNLVIIEESVTEKKNATLENQEGNGQLNYPETKTPLKSSEKHNIDAHCFLGNDRINPDLVETSLIFSKTDLNNRNISKIISESLYNNAELNIVAVNDVSNMKENDSSVKYNAANIENNLKTSVSDDIDENLLFRDQPNDNPKSNNDEFTKQTEMYMDENINEENFTVDEENDLLNQSGNSESILLDDDDTDPVLDSHAAVESKELAVEKLKENDELNDSKDSESILENDHLSYEITTESQVDKTTSESQGDDDKLNIITDTSDRHYIESPTFTQDDNETFDNNDSIANSQVEKTANESIQLANDSKKNQTIFDINKKSHNRENTESPTFTQLLESEEFFPEVNEVSSQSQNCNDANSSKSSYENCLFHGVSAVDESLEKQHCKSNEDYLTNNLKQDKYETGEKIVSQNNKQIQNKLDKGMENSINHPDFIKYLELRQDALIDEDPQLSQDEIVGYLYKTWLYEKNSKYELKKNDETKQVTLVKGLNDHGAASLKKVTWISKVEKQKGDDLTQKENHKHNVPISAQSTGESCLTNEEEQKTKSCDDILFDVGLEKHNKSNKDCLINDVKQQGCDTGKELAAHDKLNEFHEKKLSEQCDADCNAQKNEIYEDEDTSDDEPSPEYESLDEDITEDFRKHMMSIESNIKDKKDEEQIVKICDEIAKIAEKVNSPTKTVDVGCELPKAEEKTKTRGEKQILPILYEKRTKDEGENKIDEERISKVKPINKTVSQENENTNNNVEDGTIKEIFFLTKPVRKESENDKAIRQEKEIIGKNQIHYIEIDKIDESVEKPVSEENIDNKAVNQEKEIIEDNQSNHAGEDKSIKEKSVDEMDTKQEETLMNGDVFTKTATKSKKVYRTRLSVASSTDEMREYEIKTKMLPTKNELKVVLTPLKHHKSEPLNIRENTSNQDKNPESTGGKLKLSLKRDKSANNQFKIVGNGPTKTKIEESDSIRAIYVKKEDTEASPKNPKTVVLKQEIVLTKREPTLLNIENSKTETVIPEPVKENGYHRPVDRQITETPGLTDDDDFDVDAVSINSEDSEISLSNSVTYTPRRSLRSRPERERTIENALKNSEFLKYLELRQDYLIDEHPELNQDEILAYVFKTWEYEEDLKSDVKKSDDPHRLVKGLKQETPSRKKCQISQKSQPKNSLEKNFREKYEKSRKLLDESESGSITSDSSDFVVKRKTRSNSPIDSGIETSKDKTDVENNKSKSSSKSPIADLTSESSSDIALVTETNKYQDADTVIVKSEEVSTPRRALRFKTQTAKSLEKQTNSEKKQSPEGKNIVEKLNPDKKVKDERDIDSESVDSENSEITLRHLRSKVLREEASGNHKEPSLEREVKNEIDVTNSTDSEPLVKQKKKKLDKNLEKTLEHPDFIKYLELRQDALIDENPQLTQNEIVDYLYKTWLYEENSKSELKKSDEIEQASLVKGLKNQESPPAKKAKRKPKVEKQNDEDVIPKDKPKRRTIQPYYNEDYSDIEAELEVFEIFKTNRSSNIVLTKGGEKIKPSHKDTKNAKPEITAKEVEIIDNDINTEKAKTDAEEIEDEVEYVDEAELYFSELTKPKPNVFKGLIRERVCEICERTGNLIKCNGCNGRFHEDCVNKDTETVEGHTTPPKGRKKKRKLDRKPRSLDDTESQSDEKSQDVSAELNISAEEMVFDADTFEAQLSAKMKEFIDDTEIHYDSYSSDDGIDWSDTVVGQCQIVDVKLKRRRAPIDYASFKCHNCEIFDTPVCFVCKSAVSKTDSKLRQKCNVIHCRSYYHLECLDHWPQTQFNGGEPSRNNKKINEYFEALTCPRHVCHTCVSDDPRGCKTRFSGDKLARCVRCPATYHSFTKCLPAGSQILTSSYIVCPRHYQNQAKPGRVSCHVNTGWCFICALGGSLICCEYCPTSFHAECLNIKPPEGNYMCEDCETGRLPLYGEMVWVKLGHYRWWPGIILHPSEIPENIMAAKHSLGDFVVRFFGQYDYYWVNRGRVFPFQEGDSGRISSQKSKIDAAFTTAIEHAHRAFDILKNAEPNEEESLDIASSLLPPHYVKLKCNKPCGSLCGRKVEDPSLSLTQCECNPDEPDPCGPYSQCLNRMLLTECGPTCRAGERCNNRAFEKRLYPKLVPYRTPHRGWGLKTLDHIRAGQFVIEYVGELIDEEEFKRRMRRMHEIRDENFYFLTLDKERMIDAGPKGNLARFMNHCCEPNCETQKWTVLGDVRVGLFAINDIPANSEVTFNYNLECAGIDKKRCLCGAKRCSGYIGAKLKQDDSQSKKNKDAKLTKRTYKKRKHAEGSPSTSIHKPKRPIGRPRKPKEISEIEKDLLIIKNASNILSEETRQNVEEKNSNENPKKSLKRIKVSMSTEESTVSNESERKINDKIIKREIVSNSKEESTISNEASEKNLNEKSLKRKRFPNSTEESTLSNENDKKCQKTLKGIVIPNSTAESSLLNEPSQNNCNEISIKKEIVSNSIEESTSSNGRSDKKSQEKSLIKKIVCNSSQESTLSNESAKKSNEKSLKRKRVSNPTTESTLLNEQSVKRQKLDNKIDKSSEVGD